MYRIRILFISILTVCLSLSSAGALPGPENHTPSVPGPKHARITELAVDLIEGYHYRKIPLDDTLSASILERYIEHLDPNRIFFLDKDIKTATSRYGSRLDDFLRDADITPAFKLFQIYKRRVTERVHTALQLIDGRPATGLFSMPASGGGISDFTVKENYVPDRTEQPWAAGIAQLDEIWRKRIKNDFLVLRLEDEKTDAEIRETLRERYETTLRHVGQITADDICQLFINAYASAIGPHTAYLSPRNSENLFIHLSLSLEGIGAVLQSDNQYTVVREIIKGGPADKSARLHADDRIIGVGQDSRGAMVDVIGWRLQDVVNLIRGPKGSLVRLKIVPGKFGPDGQAEEITLKRNRIDLADRAASSSILRVRRKGRVLPIGVIELPTFYAQVRPPAHGGGLERSTTRDVRRIIGELKASSVEGIILDLRGNSGGSLEEAINLTGLFLDRGPVVQIKKSTGEFMVKRDTEPGMVWPGPLVVLVDRGSASASEILAGAIQDYERGLIVGETTHGKGTVQHLISLDDVDKSGQKDLGQFKLTVAQFFRVSGESTQYRGVTPDIILPGVSDPGDEGERALDNALPWDFVTRTRFSPYPSLNKTLALARAGHRRRVAREPVFDILNQEIAVRKKERDKERFSLLESRRRRERESRERASERREEQLRMAMGSEEKPDADAGEDAKDEKSGALIGEVLLRETADILADVIGVIGYRAATLVTNER